jgi:hypothetical protein
MDNPDTRATLGTLDTGQINARENRRSIHSRINNTETQATSDARHRTKPTNETQRRNTDNYKSGCTVVKHIYHLENDYFMSTFMSQGEVTEQHELAGN